MKYFSTTAISAVLLDGLPGSNANAIAGTTVYLSSPAAAYIHGAVINVDGGWLAR